MKRDVLYSIPLLCCLFLLSGCGRILDWGKEQFDQGKNLNSDISVAKSYIRSTRVYDQFTLVGAFDALWLSDEVRVNFADLHACKHGKSDEQKQVFLRRQLAENDHYISFYVLSPTNISLGEQHSEWQVFLRIDCKNYRPIEMKLVDLLPEYKYIFGDKFNKFKYAYLVLFDAKDVEEHCLIHEQITGIRLVFRSVERETALVWCVDYEGNVIRDCKKGEVENEDCCRCRP